MRYSRSARRRALVISSLAPDDVVDLEYLGLAWLYADICQYGHKALAKRLELLPRVPDLANAEVAICAEADVVIHPLRGKVAGLRQATDTFVVLLGGQGRRGEADDDAHLSILLGLTEADPIRVRRSRP